MFRYRSGHIGEIRENMQHEVHSARWVPMDEADRHLAYGGEKLIVKKALEMVQNGSGKEIPEDAEPEG